MQKIKVGKQTFCYKFTFCLNFSHKFYTSLGQAHLHMHVSSVKFHSPWTIGWVLFCRHSTNPNGINPLVWASRNAILFLNYYDTELRLNTRVEWGNICPNHIHEVDENTVNWHKKHGYLVRLFSTLELRIKTYLEIQWRHQYHWMSHQYHQAPLPRN